MWFSVELLGPQHLLVGCLIFPTFFLNPRYVSSAVLRMKTAGYGTQRADKCRHNETILCKCINPYCGIDLIVKFDSVRSSVLHRARDTLCSWSQEVTNEESKSSLIVPCPGDEPEERGRSPSSLYSSINDW